MYSSTAIRAAVVREYVHAQFVTVQVSYWDFHVFVISRHTGDRASPSPGAPFYAPRTPGWTPAPDLSPTAPRTAVWGGRGAFVCQYYLVHYCTSSRTLACFTCIPGIHKLILVSLERILSRCRVSSLLTSPELYVRNADFNRCTGGTVKKGLFFWKPVTQLST